MSKPLITTVALCTLALPALAQARPVTVTTTLNNYGGDGAYVAVYLTDAQGASTRIRLTSLTKTSGLAPSLFVLKDPRPKNVGRGKM